MSSIESIQPQTIEVIKIAKELKSPMIVAVNKIDREGADPDTVMLDLAEHDVVVEQLGGDVACVCISAKNKINIDLLEEKIVEVSQKHVDLMADYDCKAQCYIIESNFDEKAN